MPEQPETPDPEAEKLAHGIRNFGVRYDVFQCLLENGEMAVRRIRRIIGSTRDPVSLALKYLSRNGLIDSRESTPDEREEQYLPRTSYIYSLSDRARELAAQVCKPEDSGTPPQENTEQEELKAAERELLARCSSKRSGLRFIAILRAAVREGPCPQTRLAERCRMTSAAISTPVVELANLGALEKRKEGRTVFVAPTPLSQSTVSFINSHPHTHFGELLQVYEDELQQAT